MSDRLKSNNKGFTIIEVLIVLAIAGLILLIVFLAVPALQRNNRNTQRRNDISVLLGAIAEYASNNNGQIPAAAFDMTTIANTGYYSGNGTAAGNITVITGAGTGQAALATTSANDRVVLVRGHKCGTSGATVGGSARQVAAQFLVESSSGFTAQCQDS